VQQPTSAWLTAPRTARGRPRIKGDQYFELVDEFMDAIRHRFPNVFVQVPSLPRPACCFSGSTAARQCGSARRACCGPAPAVWAPPDRAWRGARR